MKPRVLTNDLVCGTIAQSEELNWVSEKVRARSCLLNPKSLALRGAFSLPGTYLHRMNTRQIRGWACAALLGVFTLHAFAQITVEDTDLPQGDTEYTFQNVAPDFLADFESSGPGWIWDFTELAVVDSTVTLVEDISGASFTAQFVFNGFDPEYQADHFYTFLNIPDFGDLGGDVGIPVQLDEVVGYHQIAGGTYNQVGLGMSLSGLELPIPFEDVDEVHPVPLTVDATLESTAAYAVEVPETFTYAVDQDRYSEVDGYGTLLLPDGSSHEVLRLKSTISSDDSVYVALAGQGFAFERETVTYTWLGDGGMPWMEVATTLGVPTVVRYQGAKPPDPDTGGADGVLTLSPTHPLFPNPAHAGQTITLGADAQATWSVWNASGSQQMGVRGTLLSTEGWAPGIYLVQNGETGVTRRLVVR